jgi:hypothetical protein
MEVKKVNLHNELVLVCKNNFIMYSLSLYRDIITITLNIYNSYFIKKIYFLYKLYV